MSDAEPASVGGGRAAPVFPRDAFQAGPEPDEGLLLLPGQKSGKSLLSIRPALS